LDGYDKDFIDTSGIKSVTYTNLKPGKYKLLVKSTNSDGVWNDALLSLSPSSSPA